MGKSMETFSRQLNYTICAILCLISMVLTGCFALNFSSINDNSSNSAFIILSPFLLIAVGITLDLSKYVFWATHNKNSHEGYKLLAVILMLFSWMASVAFFISSENEKINEYRKQTAEYLSYQSKLMYLDRTIEIKTDLLNKRLNSRFHEQWDKSETITQEIQDLQANRVNLIANEQSMGISEAYSNLVSMAFFNAIAEMLNLDRHTVRNVFYALLAFLIEVCALGLIGVCRLQQNKRTSNQPPSPITRDTSPRLPTADEHNILLQNEEANENEEETRLMNDIKNGLVPPVFNQIKALNYALSQKNIKHILQTLKNTGVLKEGPRRSLVLIKS